MLIIFVLALLWLGSLTAVQALASEVISVVDCFSTKKIEGMLRGWTNERLVMETDRVREFTVDDIVSVQFDRKVKAFVGGESIVLMANGDRLVVRPTVIADDVMIAAWVRLSRMPESKLPLEMVSAVILELPTAVVDRQRLLADLQTLPAGDDVVLLANGDRTLGEFERLDGAFIELKTKSGPLKLDRSRVRAIRFNPDLTSAPKIEGRRLSVSLVDGSRITAAAGQIQGEELKLSSAWQQGLSAPVTSILSCHVYGGRVLSLSDREPAEVSFVPYLSARWPMVKNASVLHSPLTLRETEYGAGLGMHSQMSVSYALSGNEREFRATVGLDDCANGAGSVRFAVELDGDRKWTSEEVTGRSAPIELPPVAIRGAKRLTLVVDFGQKADVSDYADWCEAVLITEPE